MAENPWNVDSIQAFLFLKCPECLFDTNVEDDFRDHAVENHPLSYTFFGKQFNVKDIKQENSEEWRRVLSCLGYDSSCGPHDTKTDIETNHSKPKTMSELVSIFDKSISCEKCHRTFGSEVSLKNHMTIIHNSSRNINSHFTKKYACGKCDQSFAFAINVRKHQWMCHRKGMKHILRLNNSNNA